MTDTQAPDVVVTEDLLDRRIPCDVLVQPATTLRRGVTYRTLLECVELRRDAFEKGPPLKDIQSDRQREKISAMQSRIEKLEAALRKLEKANDDLCGTRSQATYLAMIDNDKAKPALNALDEARREARATLSNIGGSNDG